MSKDGGPAFPHIAEAMYQGHGGIVTKQITNNGMTLRDYFAGQVISMCMSDREEHTPIEIASAISARAAYLIADAMLAERAK